MDSSTWVPIAIGTSIASVAIFMFLFHPIFVMPVKRRLKWLSCFLIGVGGLILIVSLPTWLGWGHLYFRGVRVRAEVVSMMEGSTYDPDDDGGQQFPVTHVTYQFEAEAGGQRRQYRRLGELPGRYRMGAGFVSVLYDPADPDHSRMIQEFGWTQYGLVAAAVLLALGVGSFLISRRGSRDRACNASAAARL
jgi:hypothetical protein